MGAVTRRFQMRYPLQEMMLWVTVLVLLYEGVRTSLQDLRKRGEIMLLWACQF